MFALGIVSYVASYQADAALAEHAFAQGQWRAALAFAPNSSIAIESRRCLRLAELDPSQLTVRIAPALPVKSDVAEDLAAGIWKAGFGPDISLWVGSNAIQTRWTLSLRSPQALPQVAPAIRKVAFIDMNRLWLADGEGLVLRSLLELRSDRLVTELKWAPNQTALLWKDDREWHRVELEVEDVR